MKPPREDAIAGAIGVLGDFLSEEEFAAAAQALVDGMGMERYTILDVRAGVVGRLYHNAPGELHRDLASLDALSGDLVVAKARATPIPFAWTCAPDDWWSRNAEAGYRSGVAAASIDPIGSGCVLIVSSAAPTVRVEYGTTLLTYVLMASLQISGPLRRLESPARLDCPFTQRELDCLLYKLAGKSSKETARALGIGPSSVQEYLERARSRLGVSSSYAAATTALRKGWLDMEQASRLAGLKAAAGPGQVS